MDGFFQTGCNASHYEENSICNRNSSSVLDLLQYNETFSVGVLLERLTDGRWSSKIMAELRKCKDVKGKFCKDARW